MDTNCILHTLANGLRIVYARREGNVAFCGLAVNAGSRDEAELHGLAHFVEHTIFKGTRRRKAWHILNRMELVGGELNAYTTKEETLVYSVFPSGNMQRAMELLSDLVENSMFPEHELEKEREVVLEEIHSYRDSPSEAVYDDFEDLIFAGNPLGHNILGCEATLERIGTEECRAYLKNQYVPENMVLFGVGSVTPERFMRMADRYFSQMHHSLLRQPRVPVVPQPCFDELRRIDSHQAHCVVGCPTFGMHDDRKYALLLLNNILGGPGMNSLLNVAIRERRGYAYTVESSATLFSDCGLFTIYFGSDESHASKCRKLIAAELDRLATKGLSPRALEAAKKQYAGQLLVSSESVESYALSMGKSVLNFGHVNTVNEITERIKAVTADELRTVAELISGNCSTLSFL